MTSPKVLLQRSSNGFFLFEFRAAGNELTVLVNGEVVVQAKDESHRSGIPCIRTYHCTGEFASVEVMIPNKESLIADNRRVLPGTAGTKRAEAKKRSGQANEVAPAPEANSPDHREAEWVLVQGGTVTVSVSGAESPVTAIADLPKEPFKVKVVNLEGRKSVTDDGLANVEGVTECHSINLDGTNITSQGLTHLSGLPALNHLGLKGCRQIDNSVADVLKRFRSLKSIELSDTAVTAAGAAKIRAVLPNCIVGGFDK